MGDLHAEEPAPPGGVDLGKVRPDPDRVRMEAVRAQAERVLFGRGEPARIGRFEVIGRIAGGGMGVVYEARDAQLGRKVALKVVHPREQDDDRARRRLVAEAQALARLDHPSVVKVHDIVVHQGQLVIVMELVAGMTLAAWEREAPRTWREIVDVYARAGEGLAAAHGVGVVHRDFKPANVIVGDDGRVRVLDFGLARFRGEDVDPAGIDGAPRPSTTPAGLTATGDVVGTLGFMAPEQLAGNVVAEASDQFSFCVALHRAVEGRPPFAGADVPELLASIRAGSPVVGDGRRVPAWLRAAIARGLQSEPAARFSSMPALLAELKRARGWRRWRGPILAGAVVALAGTTAAAILADREGADPLAGCDAGTGELAAIWNPARRAAVDVALTRYSESMAGALRARVVPALDAYGTDWLDVHRQTCVGHRRGLVSEDLLDRGMICLRRRLGDLGAVVRRLTELDGSDADRAVDLVVELPPLESCADAETLQADYPPPASPTLRAEVAAVRARLSDAAALEHAGRSTEASAVGDEALHAARALDYPPLVIEAALLDGRVHMERREWAAAQASLSEARRVALQHRLLGPAIEAAARSIFVEGLQTPKLDVLEHEAGLLEPLSVALPRGDRVARPLLLNNIGVSYMALQRRDDAARYFRAAREALDGVPAQDLPPELSCVDKNLAMLTREPVERERLARGVWELRKARLGELHLQTIEALESYARYLPDGPRALPLITAACAAYDQAHPSLIYPRVYCHYYRAFLTELTGDAAGAVRVYRDVASLAAQPATEDITSWRQLAAGRAHFLGGDHAAALAELVPVIERDGRSPHWWELARSYDAEVTIAAIDRARGGTAIARRRLESAIAGYRARAEITEDYEPVARRGLAEVHLGEARDRPERQEPSND